MPHYEAAARRELLTWQREMLREPGLFNRAARHLQSKINSYIPERVHEMTTTVIKQMTRAVLTGSHYTTQSPLLRGTLPERELLVKKKIDIYRHTAAAEGGITGAGGFLLGLADFPLLIAIKLKLLFEIAALYGYATEDYQERLYLLHVFQLAFSNDAQRRNVYLRIADWRDQQAQLPGSIHEFDWRTFQQEYRDYIDLPKLAQLLPVIGAPVGFVVNNHLVRRLGTTAMNAYRMRWFEAMDSRPLLNDAAPAPGPSNSPPA
jgi:hypothetical protein